MISILQLKAGMTFIYNGEIHLMIENKRFKIGRGRPVIKCKIKNINSNSITVVNMTERSKFEQAVITKKPSQFLYTSNGKAFFADCDTCEIFEIVQERIAHELNFLIADSFVDVRFWNEQPIIVVLPAKAKLMVVETVDNVNTSSNITRSMKKAVLNSNYELLVPSFIKKNEFIWVSTVDGKYCSRANPK